MRYYGYNFTLRNQGGLGAIIHDVMLANQYAEQHNLQFVFVKEGYDVPRLNGSINDIDSPNKTWHSYFTSFPIVSESDCIEIWPKFLSNTSVAKWEINEFSNLLQNKVCMFRNEIMSEINEMVTKTPFDEKTDIVVHIRSTDKKTENKLLPLEKYIDECEYALQELRDDKNRIYICTDDPSLCPEIKAYFAIKDIEVVWDDTESKDPLQELRWNGKLPKSIAQQETMIAFKNIFIMKRAKYLIGGRMSYFFRIAELLGFPSKVVNIQDNDMFGIAQYSSVNYRIRPYLKKTIPYFIDSIYKDKEVIKNYQKIYNETNIVVIPNFISENILQNIRHEIENYPWWSYSMIPNNNNWTVKYDTNISNENITECAENLEGKRFSYRFRRTQGEHYETCYCVSCKLTDTISSFPVTDLLCKIVGCRNLRPGEIFLSNYSKDDFLSIHHDKKKGDISVTFSLTYDWNPVYGGLLHFCDEMHNIYKSVVPTLGSLTIFKLDPTNGIDHFVSCVNVNKNRYTLTAWYYIIN